ncbi:hypothetical protein GCM10010156_54230 [Planobispora rosea]|uniref:PASTA domain-containing protein n=1 Tax=Planobispora rosea TaxID=35762 RepID=A0A8J3S5V8_PLARO|nr:PASTA domain-containing protein [Planobispora rosea]GGS88924.1 hypothetical protein GCM10010156_54230 [Planobispora rosea]GIH87803.1 hypothetical protein Pro02_62110 [Planobispora rosea]
MTDTVAIPDFRGMQALNAWLAGHDAGLLLQGPDPDGPEPVMNGIVVRQHPLPGALLERWGTVTVWVHHDPGGESGVHEPRRPIPPAGALGAELPEPGPSR